MSDPQVLPSAKEKPKTRKLGCEKGPTLPRDVGISGFSSCAPSSRRVESSCWGHVRI